MSIIKRPNIKQTQWGNWYGYLGATRVASFGHQPLAKDEARKWLDAETRAYVAAIAERTADKKAASVARKGAAKRAPVKRILVKRIAPKSIDILDENFEVIAGPPLTAADWLNDKAAERNRKTPRVKNGGGRFGWSELQE